VNRLVQPIGVHGDGKCPTSGERDTASQTRKLSQHG